MACSGRAIRWVIGVMAVALALSARADLQSKQGSNGVIYYRQRPVVVDATADPHSKAKAKYHKRNKTTHPFIHPVNRRYQRASREEARAEAKQQRQCDHLRHQLDGVEHSLHAGYREPRGNQLRRRQRELEGQIFDNCH